MLSSQSRVEIDIPLKDSRLTLRTTVASWNPSTIELTAPSMNGQRVCVPVGTLLDVRETCDDSILVFHSRMEAVRNGANLRWILRMPGFDQIERIQRRKALRYEVDTWCFWSESGEPIGSEEKSLLVRNISSGGALVSPDRQLKVDTHLLLNLSPLLRSQDPKGVFGFVAQARIVRSAGSTEFLYGVAFEEFDQRKRNQLGAALEAQAERVR